MCNFVEIFLALVFLLFVRKFFCFLFIFQVKSLSIYNFPKSPYFQSELHCRVAHNDKSFSFLQRDHDSSSLNLWWFLCTVQSHLSCATSFHKNNFTLYLCCLMRSSRRARHPKRTRRPAHPRRGVGVPTRWSFWGCAQSCWWRWPSLPGCCSRRWSSQLYVKFRV